MVLREGDSRNFSRETRMKQIKSRIGLAIGRAGDIIGGRPSPKVLREAIRINEGSITDEDRKRYLDNRISTLYAAGSLSRPDPYAPFPSVLLSQSIEQAANDLRNLLPQQVDAMLQQEAATTLSRVKRPLSH